MTFILKLKLGNDAMRTSRDIAGALREVSSYLERADAFGNEDVSDGPEIPRNPIRDTNGNRVGHWETVEED